MTKTLLNTETIDVVKGTAIIGQKNIVANPNFQRDVNFWSNSALATTITASGVQLVGSGIFYQNLNTSDITNGNSYMVMVYCDTVSGTWSLIGGLVASGLESSGTYSVGLTTGWNTAIFSVGATHNIQLKSSTEASTDTLVCAPVQMREALDVIITGNIINI